MYVAGNLVAAFATMLDMLLTLYLWVIIIRAVLSWVNPDPYNPIVQILYKLTEPVLARVRRWVPIGGMGLDLSPLIVIFAIIFFQTAVIRSLHQFAMTLH